MAGADFGDEREEIIGDFIVETEELIERLDQELVQLEERKDDLDLLNSIFRAAHTIKGTSSFLGFTRMTELTHKAENVLDKLRNQEFTVTAVIMDVLLRALDGIRNILEEIRNGDTTGSYDPEPVQELLIQLVDNGGALADGDESGESETETTRVMTRDDVQDNDDKLVITDENGNGGGDSLDDILSSAPAYTPNIEIPGEKRAKSGGGDALDDILSSAPKINPKLSIPGEKGSSAGGDDLDDILSSAPQINPKLSIPGEESSSGGDDLDDILSSAPSYTPTLEIPGEGKSTGKVANPSEAERLRKEAAAEKLKKDTQRIRAAMKVPPPNVQAPVKGKEEGHKIAVEQTIRVDVERLDALLNLTGELVLNRNRLANITRQLEQSNLESEVVAELANVVASISLVAGNLQRAVMKTRMLPIGKVFNRFPRMVRDLAREKKKLVELKITGSDTEVDKSVIEAIGDPLVHLVRNSVDHGIESAEERANTTKPETGTVELAAMHQGNHVVITIIDDGKGINPNIIRKIAIDRGVIDEAQSLRMSDKEARLLIFQPGFSTAKTITNTSGRGVGMDVVKTNVEALGGTIDIESEVGVGTVMSIKLPLTLAIIQALMVRSRTETYAISLANVMETVRVPAKKLQTVEGQKVVQLRDRVIPVVKLADVLDSPMPSDRGDIDWDEDQHYIVVLGLGEQRVGLAVEHLLGQEEVVIKSLGEYLQSVTGIAGSTILGDGRVALIVDVAGLMNMIYGTVSSRRS